MPHSPFILYHLCDWMWMAFRKLSSSSLLEYPIYISNRQRINAAIVLQWIGQNQQWINTEPVALFVETMLMLHCTETERVFTFLSKMELFHYNLQWSGISIQTGCKHHVPESKSWLNETIKIFGFHCMVYALICTGRWEMLCREVWKCNFPSYYQTVEFSIVESSQCVDTSRRWCRKIRGTWATFQLSWRKIIICHKVYINLWHSGESDERNKSWNKSFFLLSLLLFTFLK